MVNIERVNLKYKKNLGRSFLILMVMLIIIGCVIFIQYKNKIEDTLKEEAAITLEIISAQNATNIRMNISHKQKLLHLIAKIIEESKELRPEKV